MASVTYQYSVSLPLPWGNCTNKSIRFFEGESYTQSKCKLNHETESLLKICGCKDIQMPGQSALCTISKYITCMRDREHNTTRCPDACVVKTHSVDLSSNIISVLSAERLLNLHSNDIERRYFRAAEYRFRVTHEQMVSRLQRLQDTWQHIEHVRSYLKINVFATGTSLINRVKRAITNMDSLVRFIIHTEMFANLGNYSAAYRTYLEPSIKTIDQAHGDIITAITAFSDMLISYNYEKMPGKTENQYGNLAKKGKQATQYT
ncbi:hypothetical protein LSH36_6g15055 [Paralvinella palmiformis]|uniref:Uncharacterized protein n=1 Tax=Paralvinella palmiformis TaxID=53620 RepID=A0AAD9NGY3_9ANNE|nr:hypothetical protein LSH36_6g15055 [Paralvinella palmiformis]